MNEYEIRPVNPVSAVREYGRFVVCHSHRESAVVADGFLTRWGARRWARRRARRQGFEAVA